MGYDQFDAQKMTATVSTVGQDFTQPGTSTSSLQGCNGQSLVQSGVSGPNMALSTVDDASDDENFKQRMQGEIRSTHEVSGYQHQLASKRQHTNRNPDRPSMSPSRLLDIDTDVAMEIVVASIISDEWRTLLHHLGLSEHELETLQNKETPEVACEAGLKLWRETRGQEVTTERLVRAVKDTKVKLRTGTDQKVKLTIRERENTCMEGKAILLHKLKEMITKDVVTDTDVFDQTMERYRQLKSEVLDDTINEKGKQILLDMINEIFTETVLHDEKRFKETIRNFHKVKAEIRELCRGSVLCKLRFYRRKSQVEFMSTCKDGTLSAFLTEEYISQELVEIYGGMPLYVHIEVDEADFQRGAHFFYEDPPGHGGQSPPMCPFGQGGAHTADTQQAEPMDTQDSPTVSLIPGPTGSDCMEESIHPPVVRENQWSEPMEVKMEPMGADLDAAFEVVSKDLWSDWERLARTMGFSQSEVEDIKAGSPDQRYEHCWKLLYRWRDREGRKATLHALMQQLRMAGFHGIAEKLDIEDLSNQDEHGASKKNWDDSEASSDSDSDSDGDDDSMKGTAPPTKMKPLKMGKRAVLDPPWTTGVKKKKMGEDGDVEMVEEAGVSTSDNTEQAEVATDDLSFMLSPVDIKRWQEVMKTHVVPDSRASLEEQFRFNMLVMHLIKDEFYHKHLCHYWNDKGTFPVRLTQFVSYVVTKLGQEHCIKGSLDIEAFKGMEQDVQYQLGKFLFKQHAGGVCKVLSLESLQSCFTDDQLKYVQAWLEPTSDPGSCSLVPYYRFRHECMRQYMMAVWVAGKIHIEGETIRANDFLRQCFDISSNLDLMAYFVAGLMAQKDQVDLFSYQLSRILFSMDTTDFYVIQKVSICMAETGQVDRFESHTSQIFPDNAIDLTSWPSMSYLGKLALAQLKETFPLKCELSHEAGILILLFKSKKNKAEAQSLLSLIEPKHRSVFLYSHYKSLLDDSAALVSNTPCRIDKLYLNNLGLTDSDLSNMLSLLQFAPALKHLSLQKTSTTGSVLSTLCDYLPFIPNIEHIVLSKCRISVDCIATFAEHFQCLQKLRHLNLSQTGISSEGVKCFAHHLSRLKALEVVDLRKNKVGKDELKFLCESITDMDSIPQLILGSQTSSYRFLLGISNRRGNRLIVKTSDSNIVRMVNELSYQMYRVELSHKGKVLYSVQTDGGKNPHRMTLDLIFAGNITKNLQALAVVLPVGHRVQQADVEELKLGRTDIGDEGVRLLAEMLCYFPSLKHLDLSDNMIISKGATAMAGHMSHLQQLEWLDLSRNVMGDDGVIALADSFCFIPKLKHLDLSSNMITCTGATAVAAHMSHLQQLEWFSFCGNDIGDYGVTALADSFCFIPKLKHLDLSDNMIASTGATAMAVHMSHLQQLEWLDLSDDVTGEPVYLSLWPPSYVYLLGVYNNKGNRLTVRTGDAAVVSLVDQMFSQVYKVELSHRDKVLYSVQTDGGESPLKMTLDLTCAGNITKNLQALAAVLPVGHRVQQADVEELKLGRTGIGDEGVRLLAEMFCYFPSLKHLDLSDNMITFTGATAMAGHMSHLQQLEWFIFCGNNIGDYGVTALADSFCFIPKLKHLDLSYNGITSTGATAVAAHVPHLQQLEWLDLSGNGIGEVGVTAMYEKLDQLEKLKYLDLIIKGVSAGIRKSLLLTLSNMEHLSEVNLSTRSSSYVYLLGVYNNKGNRLTVKTGYSGVVSLVDQVFSQVYRVDLSCRGKVLYSVQTDGGKNPHRMTLDLTCAGIVTENLQALAAVLPVGHRVQQADVEELKLGSTFIQDEGVRLLAEMFCYFPKLKHLDLSLNMITSTGATAVAAHMSHLQQLEWLDLSDDVTGEVNLSFWPSSYVYLLGVYNNKGNRLTVRTCHDGVVSLVNQMFSQVYRVELSHKGKVLYSVQTDGGENLDRMTLDLTCAGDITKNLHALAAVLPVGHRVQQADVEELKLGRSLIGDEGVRLLAKMFCYFPSLKHLDLSSNMITFTGATAVAAYIPHLQQLEWLDLSDNDIGEVNLSSWPSSYVYLLGVYNNKGNRLTVRTCHAGVVSLVDQMFSQVYSVELSCQGKVLYSVQTDGGENPRKMTLDLTCAGNITKNLQALAAVLPVGHRVQQADVEELKLGMSLIGDEGVRLLAEMFCYFPSLKHLDLSDNMITFTGATAMAGHMSHLQQLEWFIFCGNNIGDYGVTALADSFCFIPKLKHLDLSYNGITSTGATAVAAHVPHLQQLEWLDLSGNGIGEVGVTAMYEKLDQLEKLKYLDLIIKGVSAGIRKSLLLTLSNMEHLLEVNLSTRSSSYVYLLGVYNNKGNRLTVKTGYSGVVSLVDQVFSQVYRVDLSCRGKVLYSVQTDGGENPHKMTLDLTCAGIVTENLQALAAVLPVGHRVQQADVEELKLGRTDIGDEGARLLAEMFCYFPSLKHLDLSFKMITSTGATAVAAHMSHLQQLEWFSFCGNDIGDYGVTALADSFYFIPKLKHLDLSDNMITSTGATAMAVHMSHLQQLEWLDLSNDVTGEPVYLGYWPSSYVYLLGVYNNKGNRLTVRTCHAGVVSFVDQMFSQMYSVELSCQGKVLYSVQTDGGENPRRMTLDLSCAGNITKNLQALAAVLPVGHHVQQADVEELKLGRSLIGDEGVRLLAEMFCYFPKLKHLDLSSKMITSTGATAVAAHMSPLQQLEWLDLSDNAIGSNGVTAINEMLLHLLQLKYFKMDTNNLSYQDKKLLLITFANMQQLSEVHFGCWWLTFGIAEHYLRVYNNKGSRLTIRTNDTDIISLVKELFSQVYTM
ncbi:uncharacterized protein [Branchiostoma lanceolatum]|uniref:uncharacterized protein isoform X2 n=1 Tax=Branchiostoma lanceolatum TaxID=7740 RepID=UPI003454ECAA